MKKIVRFLFPVALLFAVAGPAVVSCQKEEDISVASSAAMPRIIPDVVPKRNKFFIVTDGTTISTSSSGYSFVVSAGAITFDGFRCFLSRGESFGFMHECNLELKGNSVFYLNSGGVFVGAHVTLSGIGSIKIMGRDINETRYNNLFSAAEGYSLTSSGKQDEDKGLQSITFTVRKNR